MIKVVGAQPSGGTEGGSNRPTTASAGAWNGRGLSRLVRGIVSVGLTGAAANRGVHSRLDAGRFSRDCRTVARDNGQGRCLYVQRSCPGRTGRFSRQRRGGVLYGFDVVEAGRWDRFGGRQFLRWQGSGEIGKRKRVGAGHEARHRDQHRFKHGDSLGNRRNDCFNEGRSGSVRGLNDGYCNGRNRARRNHSVHHGHGRDQVVRHSRNLAGHRLQLCRRSGGYRPGVRSRGGGRGLRICWNSSGNLACHRGNGRRYGAGDTAQQGRSLRKGVGRRRGR